MITNKFDLLEKLLDYLTPEQLLNEVIDALSTDEAFDTMQYIARMNDITIDEEY